MSESHEDRKRKLLEMLDDPEAIEELKKYFDCDKETAQEMWELLRDVVLPDIS